MGKGERIMNKTMTVGELIEQLKDVPPDLRIYLWDDGERYPIAGTDDSWVCEGGWLDINMGRVLL
jgi:hypothetical protein